MENKKLYGISSVTEKALETVAQSIIAMMDKVGHHPEKPWIDSHYYGTAENINGRKYNGSNLLLLHQCGQLPVFLTFKQAQDLNVSVNKGAKSIPIFFWQAVLRDEKGKIVPDKVLEQMTEQEKEQLKKSFFMKLYRVFSIDSTNYKTQYPEKYKEYQDRFKEVQISDKNGMYENAALDRLVNKNEWVVPIQADKFSAGAYYSPIMDEIVMPTKGQFKLGKDDKSIYSNGMMYYSTLLHEMTHSTGAADRLNRDIGGRFGDKKYAKEELIAELTAAIIGKQMGFDKTIMENNAMYLNNWRKAIKEEPPFLLKLLSDVNKAAGFINSYIEKQKLALDKENTISQKQEKSQWVVEFNEHTAKEKNYQGLKVTPSLLDEIKKLDENYYQKKHGYRKFYFDKIIDGKTVEHLRIDIGDGKKNNKDLYDYIGKDLGIVAKKEQDIKDVVVVAQKNGDWAIRGKIDGKDTGLLSLDRQNAIKYLSMTDFTAQQQFGKELIAELSSKQDIKINKEHHKSLHL